MKLAISSSLQEVLDRVLEFLPQLGIGFLVLVGLGLAAAAFGGVRRRRRTAKPGPSTGEAFAGGLEGKE